MDLSPAISTSALLSLVLLLSFLLYRKVLKKIEGFPFYDVVLRPAYDHLTGKIPKEVPLTAHIFKIILDGCKRNYDKGIFMTFSTRPVLITFSEEAIKFFFNKKIASEKPPEYAPFAEFAGESSILTNNGEKYKIHRKMIDPAFNMGILKEKIPLFNEHALRLVGDMKKLAGKPSVDYLDALKFNYFSALSEAIFGLKQDDEKGRQESLKMCSGVDSLLEMIISRIVYPWRRPNFLLPFYTFGREFLKHKEECNSFKCRVIEDMKKLVTSNTPVNCSIKKDATSDRFSSYLRKSLSYILLNQHLKNPTSFTLQELIDEVGSMIGAGYDTVTCTTVWCLYLLGLHPEIQEKAFEEVQSTTYGDIRYEDLCNLTYLEAVIKETLRMYPILPLIGRSLTEDVQFGKYKVHKGTTIAFVLYIANRNPEIFPDPEKFDPDRFLSSDPRRTGMYLPFAEGNRSCIGKQFAMLEMKIFLAHLLRNFSFFSLDKREDIVLCWNVVLAPSKPLYMKITSRCAEERHLSNGKESI